MARHLNGGVSVEGWERWILASARTTGGGRAKRWGRNSGEILRGPRNDNWAVRGMGPRIREDNGRGAGEAVGAQQRRDSSRASE